MSIQVKNLEYVYMPGTPYEVKALKGISFDVKDGEFVSIIGHTGCGKSTLMQTMNGLLMPSSGTIEVEGFTITKDTKNLAELRKHVGLVFQYPEYQLFEETVVKDVAYGPHNLGLPEAEVQERVREALQLVGLSYDEMLERSPFDLSGGQKRRVAVAGIIAMHPSVLILDEPTAGLDPRGRDELLAQIDKLHRETGNTVLLVSHSMETAAELADRILVMNDGVIVNYGTPEEVFSRSEELKSIGLGVPQVTELFAELRKQYPELPADVYTMDKAHSVLREWLKGRRG